MTSVEPTAPAPVEPAPKKKHRVVLWVFLAVQVLFVLWIVAVASRVIGIPNDCKGIDTDECGYGDGLVSAILVVLSVALWMVVDLLFMAVIYSVAPVEPAPKKKSRIFLWVFLAVQVLFVIWIVDLAPQGGNGLVLVGVMTWMVVHFFVAVIYTVYCLAKGN